MPIKKVKKQVIFHLFLEFLGVRYTPGRIDSNKRGYIKPEKLKEYQKEIIKSWIDDNAGIPLRTNVTKVQEEMDISVGKSTMDRILQSFHYSWKRLSIIPERRNNVSTLNIRERYATGYLELLQSFREHQFIFIVECGVNISMITSHGRSKIGSPAIYVVPNLRSSNISIIAAMNVNGMLLHKWHDQAFNRDLFGYYFDELLEKIRALNIEHATIVMDNVSFHHCEEISQQISEAGHTLLFLPPYSPFMNPIENMFSKWKGEIRNMRSENSGELYPNITAASSLITSSDCSGYDSHMFRYINRCLRREIIED
ncbi:hypothetical protein RF11_14809 [Thelohanellus kitauei]|uniref:Tc1-like transposase DDE domain-containing protein n=1 Tax=Thelohanellus kitauei TaxID=669202 RepID=A0A0C2I6K5_THEKT|nr:hypothetical protein RF11_14809 [Thelohanellus kitauei]